MRQGRLFGKRQAPIRGKVYKCPEGLQSPPHNHRSASDHLPPPLVALLYMVLLLIGVTFASLHQHVSSSPHPLSLSSPPAQLRRNQKGGLPLYNVTKVNSKIRSIHQICVLTCQPLDYLSCHYPRALLVIIPLFSVIIPPLALPLTTDRPCPFFRSEARPKRLF